MFRQDFTCPALLDPMITLPRTGLSPAPPAFPCGSVKICRHWPGPRSLATTNGVSLMSFPPGT